MKYYILFAAITRREAGDFARAVNREAGVPGFAKVARPERGALPMPYRYIVITTSETLRTCADMLDAARAGVRPVRFPRLQLAKERFYDVLIGAIEALTRAVIAWKRWKAGKIEGIRK